MAISRSTTFSLALLALICLPLLASAQDPVLTFEFDPPDELRLIRGDVWQGVGIVQNHIDFTEFRLSCVVWNLDDGDAGNNALSLDPQAGEIGANGRVEIDIAIESEELIPGRYRTLILLFWGEDRLQDEATFDFEVRPAPPRLIYDFPDLERDLFRGQSRRIVGRIGNDGDEAAGFTISVEYLREENQDEFPPWLIVDPVEGEVAEHSVAIITLTFDATRLRPDDYSAELHIRSNDPNQADAIAAAFLHVSGRPELAVDDPDQWIVDGRLDWNNRFPDLFTRFPYPLVLTIRNVGEEQLEIRDAVFNTEFFTIDPADYTLDPNQSAVMTLTFEAQEAGEYEGRLTLPTNDPLHEDIELPVHAQAFDPPRYPMEEGPIEEWLVTGEIVERVIPIRNEGGSPLRFAVEIEVLEEPERDGSARSLRSMPQPGGAARDEAGDLIARFQGPNAAGEYCSPIGYDQENDLCFIANYYDSTIHVWTHQNYENFEEVNRFEVPRPMDGGFYNGVLYVNNFGNNQLLRRFDIEGNALEDLQLGFRCYGLAFDELDGLMFAREWGGANLIRVFTMEGIDLGEQVGFIRNWPQFCGNNPNLYQLEWVANHEDGQLWIGNNADRRLYQIHVDTDRWVADQQVRSFPAQISNPFDACVHDGHNIWVGGWANDDIRIYDDGNIERYWITVEPIEGVVAPGESTDLTVTLDATGIIWGFYSAEIHIRTNDPDAPDQIIEVFMEVFAPEPPILALVWPEGDGYPDMIDFNRRQRWIFPGDTVTVPIMIRNIRNEGVAVLEVVIDLDERLPIEVEPREIRLESGEELILPLRYIPDDEGEFGAYIYFIDNGIDDAAEVIWMQGRAQHPPQIIHDPQQLELEGVLWGDWDGNPLGLNIDEFLLRNDGRGVLHVDSINAYSDFRFGAHIRPQSFDLAPDAERNVHFDLYIPAEGDYEFFFVIFSNDRVTPTDTIFASIHITRERIIVIDPSNTNHSVLVTGVFFDGEPVAPGWEIGVLTPGGTLCGLERWGVEQVGIAVWGADDDHPDYFRAGQRMSFILWDPQAEREYNAVARVQEGSLFWQANGFTIISLSNMPPHRGYHLRQGWNLFSINIIPVQEYWVRNEGPDFIRMIQQLRYGDQHHVILIKNERGIFISPQFGYGGILYWDLQDGYYFKVDQDVDVSWPGQPIAPDADIPLRQGWNIAPYYPDYQLLAIRPNFHVLSPIIDHVIIAKDDNGAFMYPAGNFSSMAPWREGKAYQIKVDEAVTLNYPPPQEFNSNSSRTAIPGCPDFDSQEWLSYHFQPTTRTGRNMSVLLNAEFRMQNLEYEVGAFTEGGLCVGNSKFLTLNSKFQIGLPVWGDDPSTPEIDGALEGEALDFRLWDGTTETVVLPVWSEEDRHSCLSYQTDGFAIGIIDPRQTGMPNLPLDLALESVFPNPFNAVTTVTFSLPASSPVRCIVKDMNGREVAILVNAKMDAGRYSIPWQASGVPGGLYFITLEAALQRCAAKLVLSK